MGSKWRNQERRCHAGENWCVPLAVNATRLMVPEEEGLGGALTTTPLATSGQWTNVSTNRGSLSACVLHAVCRLVDLNWPYSAIVAWNFICAKDVDNEVRRRYLCEPLYDFPYGLCATVVSTSKVFEFVWQENCNFVCSILEILLFYITIILVAI